jgi:hypothetical protein
MLTGALEDNILTTLCWDTAHASELALRVTPELFSTRVYRDIAEKAIEHLERYQAPPGAHIKDLFEQQLKRGNDEGKFLKQTLDAMEELFPKLQYEFVEDHLDRFLEERQFTNALEKAMEELSRGELEAAREALYAEAPIQMETGPGTFMHEPNHALRFLNEDEDDTFTTGISVLDNMGVVPARKQMLILMAPSNVGKTWFLINVGKQAMMRGKSTLHITLEMSEEQTAQRYVQAIYAMTKEEVSQVRITTFKRDDLGYCIDVEQDYINPKTLNRASRRDVSAKLKSLKRRGPVLIKEFPGGTLTLGQLNAYLDYLERQHSFIPDVLIVDQPDNMAVDPKNLRIELGRLYVRLRGMGALRNKKRGGMAVVAVTQAGREAMGAKVVRKNQIAEDISKVATADVILTVSQTDEEEKLGLARVLVDKSRHTKKNTNILISQSFEVGQFCLDSVYMNNRLFDQINKGEKE